jgi:small subunit ribosomal protein S6
MARQYDLMLLLDADAPEERRTSAVAEVERLIGGQGEVVAVHEWGVRKLAYEIHQRNEADYRWLRFESAPELLDALDHSLKIADGVLRFRIFRVDPQAPTAAPPASGAAAWSGVAGRAAALARRRSALALPLAAVRRGQPDVRVP